MQGSQALVKTPSYIITKAVLYVALLLSTMGLLVATSLWLYNQQAEKAEFLHKQQIPFIKNNAQLMKSVAELENQLVAQQLAIRHQELDQPLEDVKQAWLEIVDLSKQHVLMVNDSLRDNTADDIAQTAQTFADGYKKFVILVDDLILIRQSRNGQYSANTKTLIEIIEQVDNIRRDKQRLLNKNSLDFINSQNRVKTNSFNSVIALMNEGQFYQYIYQELLKLQNQLTALSSTVTPHHFNQISTQIATLTKNINKELQTNKASDKQLKQLTADISSITNQLMGSGQLFAKWRDENLTTNKVISQLKDYQDFLTQTALLIERPNFYDLPEFELNLPIIGVKVKESTMLPVGFLFILILVFSSGFLAWRILNLVNRTFHAGADHMQLEHEKELQAEQALIKVKNKEKSQLKSIMETNTHSELKQTEKQAIAELDEEVEEAQPSFYQINNLVMNLEKFNQYHGSAEMAVFMLDDYMDRNKQNFQKLKDALAHENLARVNEINDAILKTAVILSAPRLIKVCEQLKNVCDKQTIHQAVPLIVEMNEAISEVAKFVEES
ncbi:hypothetical protein RI845_18010 [Thalassotalea nanhaiensis]|uniref:Uncharacterized protein n=1 Tax=Thalassotalea nanhaiensis TaxID=3065648 RepID=A0ABY9THV6_9GAMM|nr:hypothetical protein RI845_18010 [Colwelliaceae bacterium SQ345]